MVVIDSNLRRPLLALLASGIAEAYRRVESGQPLTLPYPPPLQRALNLLTFECLTHGVKPPAGVPELLRWAHADPSSWPVCVDPGAVGFGQLLVNGAPTRLCEEWAVAGGDVEGELYERQIVSKLRAACRSAGRPDVYTAWRRFVITHPVLTEFDLRETITSASLGLVGGVLTQCYPYAPHECHLDGHVVACADCGNLLVRGSGQLHCANDRCTRRGPPREGERISLSLEPRWLARPLRVFVASPGVAELALERRLSALGLTIELWPFFDSYDLLVGFPGGCRWAVDVKDWVNPYLLAHSLEPIPPVGDWRQAFIVPTTAACHGRPGYLQTLRNQSHARLTGTRTRVVSDTWLVRRATKQLEEARDA
jgi:hypothetical protein